MTRRNPPVNSIGTVIISLALVCACSGIGAREDDTTSNASKDGDEPRGMSASVESSPRETSDDEQVESDRAGEPSEGEAPQVNPIDGASEASPIDSVPLEDESETPVDDESTDTEPPGPSEDNTSEVVPLEEDTCSDGIADQVYDRYVAPLVAGEQPSSCNQCHLSGVNLGNFVRATPCESMACLVQSGEVDLDDPLGSKILERIKLADPQSDLITAGVVDREYEGFLAWIEYSAGCHASVCGDIDDACGGPANALDTPQGPLGQCSEQELADQFERSVYQTLKGRCAGCHDPDGPRFEPGVLWLDLREGGSLRTMYNIVGRGDINTQEPEQSLLLLKPLAEEQGGVVHLGGPKFADRDDATYVTTLQWIRAYAQCKQDGALGTFPEEPTVSIVTPLQGEVRSNPVRLDGLAIDAQEGQLLEGVLWRSDRDGALGAVAVVPEANLSPGPHVLTFEATDSDGNRVEHSVEITVE